MKRSPGAALVAGSTLCLALAGCGSSDLGSGTPGAASSASIAPVTADPALHAKLPAEIARRGTIVVGNDATYKPNEYMDTDGKTVIGMDIDLFDAVSARLGVKAQYDNSAFAAILNGVISQKYDVGVSSFTVNAQRVKQVNMVSYLDAGTLWATAKGNPKGVDRTKPCGHTVAVQTGTTQLDELNQTNATTCKANPVKLLPFQDQSAVNTALVSGRAEAMSADSPITQLAIKESNGNLEALGEVYASAPYGIVVQKNQAQLAQAIQQALTDIKASGQYDAILDKWGQKASAVSSFQVNPTVS